MQLKHIDNSFYHLTAAQARKLLAGNSIPGWGRMARVDKSQLAQVVLLRRNWGSGWAEGTPGAAAKASSAYVQRTPLSWFDGKPVKGGWVWALSLYFSPNY